LFDIDDAENKVVTLDFQVLSLLAVAFSAGGDGGRKIA